MDATTKTQIDRLIALYTLTERDLEAAILAYGLQSERLLEEANKVIDQLDERVRARILNVVQRVVLYETRLAERRIRGSKLEVTEDLVRTIGSRFYSTFAQQHAEVRQAVTETIERGFGRGASLADRMALQKAVQQHGIQALKRADGSSLSIRATGKAMVRTRVNQLQAETQLSRYRAGKVEKVRFVAGGYCTFAGEGGTCTGLDGREFPIDAIPDWAQIPRHLYSNSRWLPVIPGS